MESAITTITWTARKGNSTSSIRINCSKMISWVNWKNILICKKLLSPQQDSSSRKISSRRNFPFIWLYKRIRFRGLKIIQIASFWWYKQSLGVSRLLIDNWTRIRSRLGFRMDNSLLKNITRHRLKTILSFTLKRNIKKWWNCQRFRQNLKLKSEEIPRC